MKVNRRVAAALAAVLMVVTAVTEPVTAASYEQEIEPERLQQEAAVSSGDIDRTVSGADSISAADMESEKAGDRAPTEQPSEELQEGMKVTDGQEISSAWSKERQASETAIQGPVNQEISQDEAMDEAYKDIDLLDQETLDKALAEGLVEFIPNEENINEEYQRAGAAASGDIVSVASKEVGVSGRPNKYTYWLGSIAGTYSYAWCHAFVSWCGAQAGESSQVPRTASCFYGAQEFKARGQWKNRITGYVPKSGDIIYFDWDANGGYDHVGIVNYVSAGRVHTIEGNAGDAVKYDGGRADGYALTDSQIIGYGTPNYSSTPTAQGCQGCLDSVSGGVSCVKVRGWTFDNKSPAQSLDVHVYVGGPAGSGAPGYAIKADKTRTDVGAAFTGVGDNHGFDQSIVVTKTGSQPVYVYAISASADDPNPLIGSGTVNIKADTKSPQISNVNVSDISVEGYTVTCQVSDNVGIGKVEFVAWHASQTRDQAVSFSGTVENGTAQCFIPIGQLGNQSGSYITYVCAYDLAGNSLEKAVNVVNIDHTSLSQYKLQNISTDFIASIEGEGSQVAVTGLEDTSDVVGRPAAKMDSQIWEFKRAQDGSYSIQLKTDGRYLSVASLSDNSVAVAALQTSQEENPYWQIYQAGEDSYYLKPAADEGRVLGLQQVSDSEDAAIVLDTFAAASEQRFHIRKLSTNVKSIRLSKSKLTIGKEGTTKNLTATVNPASAADEKILWKSSDTSVVTVDKNGAVTSVGNGVADVTASTEDGSITAVCKVTVAIKATGVNLDKQQIKLDKKGATQKLVASVLPANAGNQAVVWSSSNAKVAKVNQSGVVTAVANGQAEITVETVDGNKTAVCSATVLIPQVGAGGTVKSGQYTYSADFIQDLSSFKTVIYRQKKGGNKKELLQVGTKAYLKLVYGKKLYYEETDGSGKRNLCAMDIQTFKSKVVRANATVVGNYGKRFLVKPYAKKVKPQSYYLLNVANGKVKKISSSCLAAHITKTKIYYLETVSGNTGKGWKARVRSCNLSGGKKKYVTSNLTVAAYKKITAKLLVYQSGKTWYQYTYATKKKKKVSG